MTSCLKLFNQRLQHQILQDVHNVTTFLKCEEPVPTLIWPCGRVDMIGFLILQLSTARLLTIPCFGFFETIFVDVILKYFECIRNMRYSRVHVTYFFTVFTVALALRLFDPFAADCDIVFAGTIQKQYFLSLSLTNADAYS